LDGGRTGGRPSTVPKASTVTRYVFAGSEMALDNVNGTWTPLILIRPPMMSDEKAFDGCGEAAQRQVSPG
jgi:hypothetical protein